MTERLTKRQKQVAVALLERPGEWIEFDRGEFRYVLALYHLGFVSFGRDSDPNKRPASLTFEARLHREKIEEARRLVTDEPAPKVRISYEVRYLSPIGGKTITEQAPDKDEAFRRRTALNLDLTTAIPNTIEVIEVSRKRIA